MTYLLDTNVVSALRRPSAANAAVWSWAASRQIESMFISVVTIFELERGILQLERRDAPQGRALREWFDNTVLKVFADRILTVDTAIAVRAAALHVPDPKPERDALIAATALTLGLKVATRNERDFQRTGVALENPWKA